MSGLANDWLPAMQEEFKKPYYAQLYKKVLDEYHSAQVFPPAADIFNAFHFTPLDQVKVVIL